MLMHVHTIHTHHARCPYIYPYTHTHSRDIHTTPSYTLLRHTHPVTLPYTQTPSPTHKHFPLHKTIGIDALEHNLVQANKSCSAVLTRFSLVDDEDLQGVGVWCIYDVAACMM